MPFTPDVRLVNTFDRPFDNAVAAARTCYSSKGIVTPGQAAGDHLSDPGKRERALARRNGLAQSIYQAGHHTTLQHAHVQFAIGDVSRQFVWTFLHSHPFYNSEQVSQRYVEVKPEAVIVPPMERDAEEVYRQAVNAQMAAYHLLNDRLYLIAEAAYLRRFPGRKDDKRLKADVQKRCMEVARYVLPLGTSTYLYHTVSLLTLLRYRRLCEVYDTPTESRAVVEAMCEALLAQDPDVATVMEDPLPLEETPEYALWSGVQDAVSASSREAFAKAFDASLDGYASKLVSAPTDAEALLAGAVREVFGLMPTQLSDDDAIAAVFKPSGEAMNLDFHNKVARAAQHLVYVFKRKLSHTADSQDQRHRLTPGSRPSLVAVYPEAPDYLIPHMVAGDEGVRAVYDEAMERAWEAVGRLESMGVPREFAAYLLPNAVAVRYTESGSLLALKHKSAMRLCFNAQEEIFRASLDEALQVKALHPRIGERLLPPCTPRYQNGFSPKCPEGDRYCGVGVWKLAQEALMDARGIL